MGQIHVKVSDMEQAQWNQYCADSGTTTSDEFRTLMRSRIADGARPSITPVARIKQKKARVPVYLTVGEIDAIAKLQSLDGGTRASWIIRFIRAGLTREPVMDQEAINNLKSARTAADDIGKNLNQLMLHLNSGGKTSESKVLPIIEQCIVAISELKVRVTDLVSANRRELS